MPPSPPSSTEARSARLVVGGGALAVAFVGVIAEASSYAWRDVWSWLPDLLTGWTIAAAGLLVLLRVPSKRVGALLTASGLAWFVGNFETNSVDAIAWAGRHGVLLHRALLVQLLVTFPSGRAHGRVERTAVVLAYAITLATTIRWSDAGTLAVAVVLAAAAELRVRRSLGTERRARRYAGRAATLLALALGTVAVVYLLTGAAGPRRAAFLGYEATLCMVALWVSAGSLRRPWERAAVTDLVVDLGETRARSVRDALAQALGDPTLAVGYRLEGDLEYFDTDGRRLDLLQLDGSRRVTHVEREGEEVAVLVHDAAVLDDPTLLEAVAVATRLAASNARLQAEVRAQVRELEAARRRVLDAGDAERRRLEDRLQTGATHRLAALGRSLAQARGAAGPGSAERVAAAEAQLAKVSADLAELAAGLHPRALTEAGLESSLASLVERSTLAVDLRLHLERMPEEVEVALFFVASEALANVAKYAGAGRAWISAATVDGRATIEVKDDGVGGADTARGTGLRGLADRVEAIGGTFVIESPPGCGTRVVASVPLGDG